jgi:phage-related protein
MTWIQSNISFGAYTFPAAFGLDTVQQPNQIDETKIPFLDGTSAPAGSRQSKIIRITGFIGGYGAVDSTGTYIMTQDQAKVEFDLLSAAVEAGYQKLSVGDTPARYIYAQKKTMTITPVEGSGRTGLLITIDFIAQDPRWLSTIVTATNFGTGATNTITNAGNIFTFPKLTIAGVFVNPVFKVTPHGSSGYIQQTYTITLAGGDVLTIDCDPRNRANGVLLNGAPRLDVLGTTGITNTVGDAAFFPYLLAGTNTVQTSATSGSGTMTLSTQDAWY